LEKLKNTDGIDNTKVEKLGQDLDKAAQNANKLNGTLLKTRTASNSLSSAAGALNMIGTLFNNGSEAGERFSGIIMGIAGGLYLVDGISKAMAGSNPFFALAMGITGIINGLS